MKHKKKLKVKIVIWIYVILMIILSALVFCFGKKAIFDNDVYKLGYKENSDIDYEVCLLDNEFYESKCLSKNMKYVASLIENINLEFKYLFTTDNLVDFDSGYYITLLLVISDPADDDNILYSKEKILVDEKFDSVYKSNKLLVNDSISVDYIKYNTIANKFKSTYGVAANARLEVHMVVANNVRLSKKKDLKYSSKPDLVVSIPLSENSINIKLNYALINNNDSVTYKDDSLVSDHKSFFIASVLCVLDLYVLILLINCISKLNKSYTMYDKNLMNILKEYDRMIVESDSPLNKDDYNIISISKFTELIDVRDNLKLPIIFNELKKNKLSYFYIKNDKDLYLYVLEDKDEKK